MPAFIFIFKYIKNNNKYKELKKNKNIYKKLNCSKSYNYINTITIIILFIIIKVY